MLDYSEARFTELRHRELTGELTSAEQEELSALIEAIEAEEEQTVAPAMTSLLAEQAMMKHRLQILQANNEALTHLRDEQEQLVLEARQWLQEFQQRHLQIRQTYKELTGETLTAS